MKISFALTDTRTSQNTMVDRWGTVFTDLKAVMFVMCDCTRRIRGKFEGQMSGVGPFSAFNERNRGLGLSFENNTFGNVSRGCT